MKEGFYQDLFNSRQGLCCTLQVVGHGVQVAPKVCWEHATLNGATQFLEIRQGQKLYNSGELIPLFFPLGQATSGIGIGAGPHKSIMTLLFACTGHCVGSLLGRHTNDGANPSFFLTVNYFLADSNGMISRSLPDLARNFMFSISEPSVLTSRPATGIRVASTDSTSTAPRRTSKRHAR